MNPIRVRANGELCYAREITNCAADLHSAARPRIDRDQSEALLLVARARPRSGQRRDFETANTMASIANERSSQLGSVGAKTNEFFRQKLCVLNGQLSGPEAGKQQQSICVNLSWPLLTGRLRLRVKVNYSRTLAAIKRTRPGGSARPERASEDEESK